MKWLVSITVLFVLATLFAPSAHAIIFLPALILIPIAKIVAIVIAGFALPALGLGTLLSKMSGKPLRKILLFTVAGLIIAGILIAVIIKLLNPDRPLF